MKIRILLVLLICGLLLCGCGEDTPAETTTLPATDPVPTTTAANTPVYNEDGVPSLTVAPTDPIGDMFEGFLGFPEIELPEDPWEDDGVVAVPVTTPVTKPTTPVDSNDDAANTLPEDVWDEDDSSEVSEPVQTTYVNSDTLPEDVWED